MKFVLLIYQPDRYDPMALSKEEHGRIAAEYKAVNATANVTPGPPLGLPGKATTVRVQDGETAAAQGPFLEGGAVGGYMVFEAETLEEAVALAARIPAARLGGAVEIRPCEVYW